jgi:predicted chitinase
MINKQYFFDHVRLRIFNNKLNEGQVGGCEAIIDAFEESGLTDTRWLAYMLATAHLETAYTMQPIKEYGGAEYFVKRYWLNKKIAKSLGNLSAEDAVNFCGRGFVQITGRDNYQRFSDLLEIDLMNRPSLALQLDVAVNIMFVGMTKGLFTGKKLSDYFNDKLDDWINARRIINGTDKNEFVADKGQKFFDAITIKM